MIVVSACLAGVRCRYNGEAFAVAEVVELVLSGRAIPVCPEVLGGLPIPRPPGEWRDGRIVSADGRDFTDEYRAGARIAAEIARLAGCRRAILKARSPSCGCGRIYDGTFSGRLIPGDGMFAALLKQQGIAALTELDLPPEPESC